jgi:hypothetical protein
MAIETAHQVLNKTEWTELAKIASNNPHQNHFLCDSSSLPPGHVFGSFCKPIPSPMKGMAPRDSWSCNVPDKYMILNPCQKHGFPCGFFNVTSGWCDGNSYKVDNYDVDTYSDYSTYLVE